MFGIGTNFTFPHFLFHENKKHLKKIIMPRKNSSPKSKFAGTAVFAAAIAAGTLASGCASIVSKSSYPVTISSSPEGADFTVKNADGKTIHKGKTPSTLLLESGCGFFRGETYWVRFEKDGYDAAYAEIDSTLDPWYIGNIVFGGLIGLLIVDPLTGAMWKIPEPECTPLRLYGESAAIDAETL